MKWLLCLSLVSWSLMGMNGQQPEAKKKDPAANDLAKMQGKWQVIETENEGTVYKSGDRGAVILIEKSFLIDLDGEGKPCGKASLKLDSSRSPKRMDLTIVFNNLFPATKENFSRQLPA